MLNIVKLSEEKKNKRYLTNHFSMEFMTIAVDSSQSSSQWTSLKSLTVNILGFMDHTVSNETAPLYYCNEKQAIDNMQINGNDCSNET